MRYDMLVSNLVSACTHKYTSSCVYYECMYTHIIRYDSLPNCRRDGDLSAGVSVSTHVGAGIRKQANWIQWSEIVICQESFLCLVKVVLGFLHACTGIPVAVCMRCVHTHVNMTVYRRDDGRFLSFKLCAEPKNNQAGLLVNGYGWNCYWPDMVWCASIESCSRISACTHK